MTIDDERTFERNGELYTVQVYMYGRWFYRVTSHVRGLLDSASLDTDDPWAEVERMFPECVGA